MKSVRGGSPKAIAKTVKAAVPAPAAPPVSVNGLAMLVAAGRYTPDEIGAAVGMDPDRLRRLSKEEGFRALVTDYGRRFAVSAAEAKLLEDADAEKTVETLRKFRDGPIEDPVTDRVRLQAAKILFDRQLPPPARTSSAEQKVVINLDVEAVERMQHLMGRRRLPVIDVEVEADGAAETSDPSV